MNIEIFYKIWYLVSNFQTKYSWKLLDSCRNRFINQNSNTTVKAFEQRLF